MNTLHKIIWRPRCLLLPDKSYLSMSFGLCLFVNLYVDHKTCWICPIKSCKNKLMTALRTFVLVPQPKTQLTKVLFSCQNILFGSLVISLCMKQRKWLKECPRKEHRRSVTLPVMLFKQRCLWYTSYPGRWEESCVILASNRVPLSKDALDVELFSTVTKTARGLIGRPIINTESVMLIGE